MKIELETYNPAWRETFILESQAIMQVLAQARPVVEHIGSTAVVGLSAKPVIDIMIGLPDFSIAGDLIPAMEGLGYKYIAEYEDVIPDRKFFSKSSGGRRSHHLHMVELNEDYWDRHMFFRNHLRNNENAKFAYQDLKMRLAKLDWEDRNQYGMAKSAFIRAIEEKHF